MARKTKQARGREQHLVLTGDVVRSRDVADREALRADLVSVLRALSREYADIALVPLSITAGDEFQGVFRPDGRIVALVDALERELFPVQVRVGIGIGEVSTAFAERSQEMDGPAFVFAREAIEATRKFRPDAWLQFRTPDETFDLAANAIALLLGQVKQRWEAVHWRRAALKDSGLDVNDIAELEGVSHGAVSHTLRTSGYELVRVGGFGRADVEVLLMLACRLTFRHVSLQANMARRRTWGRFQESVPGPICGGIGSWVIRLPSEPSSVMAFLW